MEWGEEEEPKLIRLQPPLTYLFHLETWTPKRERSKLLIIDNKMVDELKRIFPDLYISRIPRIGKYF